MDEPLSNLDATLRVQTRAELVDLHERVRTTFVYVTHDQVEAMTMADRVAVIQDGRLQQVGPPSAVYDTPANAVVARFIGSPPMNLLAGRLDHAGVATKAGELALDASTIGADSGRDVRVGFRPEHVQLSGDGPLTGRVLLIEALGHERLIHCEMEGGERVAVRVDADAAAPTEDAAVRLRPNPDRLHLFAADTGERLR
jgi:multiple sugar transport system ATP-binding protein